MMTAQHSRAFIPRCVWDDYECVRALGSGNFASIFLAKCRHSPSRLVAVKMCARCDIAKDKVLVREFECLDLTQHPSIVELIGGYVWDTGRCLVLEYAEEGDLMTFLRENPHFLTERKIRSVMVQLLRAVSYLHQNAWVHRDIKPHNVLVTRVEPLTVKLADFGLCKEVKVASLVWARQNSAGDGDFLAPDILDAMSQQMPIKSLEYLMNDAFALGCILYYLISGTAPSRNNLSASFASPQTTFPKVSPQAINLCHQMLADSARTRLGVDAALQHDWLCDPMAWRSSSDFAPPSEEMQSRQQSASDVLFPVARDGADGADGSGVRGDTPLPTMLSDEPEASFAFVDSFDELAGDEG